MPNPCRDADNAAQQRLHSSVVPFRKARCSLKGKDRAFEADDSAAEYRKMSGCADVTNSATSREQEHPHLLRDDVGILVEAKADDESEKWKTYTIVPPVLWASVMPLADDNTKRLYDDVLIAIVNYVYDFEIRSDVAWRNAKVALLDAIGCAIESLEISEECALMLGPVWPGAGDVPNGFKLPGTRFQLDPIKGAFDMGAMIRYLDHNDAFPGSEWGHPSDNLGAILAVADCMSRASSSLPNASGPQATIQTVLIGMIKAYEIQGCFQIKNAFNKVGLDHTILVKIASTTVVCWMLGLTTQQALSALSHAWMDGHPLRVYRQSPNAGPRKGWAAGDACMRAVHLALLARADQPGAPTVLTQPKWGFYDVLFRGQSFQLPRPFGTWVMENIIFKVNTAEGHGMTGVEAALLISQELRERNLSPEQEIAHIQVRTQAAGMTIINKQGPLHNAADRDHCMQYMIAVVLLKGTMIVTSDYQNDNEWAKSTAVEHLRAKIDMVEDPAFTADYHDPDKRKVANALLVTLKDGTKLPEVVVDYPLGHPKREDTVEAVKQKTRHNLGMRFSQHQVDDIIRTTEDTEFLDMSVSKFVDMFTK